MLFSTQFVLLCMLVLSGAIGSPCVADERGLPAAERSALIAAAQSAYAVGNFSEAVRLGEELVANDREAYGILSEITRGSIVWKRSALEKLGDYPTAIELQTELVTALRGEHGRDHWKTKSDSLLLEELQSVSQMSEEDRQELIATRKLMSQCYRQAAANRFDNAKQAGDAAIIRLESLFGSECWQCSSVLNNLSIAADGAGKPDEALRYGRKALAVQAKNLGLQHPDTVLRLNTLASAEMETGNSNSAEQRLNRAIEIQEELGEKDSTTTALLLNNLGELHRKTSRFELAKSELRRAIEMRMSLLGKFHPDTITSQSNLGVALSESGDYDQALELATRACQSRLAMFGADHLDSAGSLNNVGTCYQKLGDYDEAAKWIRQSVDAYRNLLGEEHPQTIAMLNNLASVYLEKGDLAQALEMLRQTVDRSRQTQHLDLTARCLNQLGSCLREIGDYPTALMHLLESRDIVEKRFGNQSAEALLARHNLADMKRRIGEWEDAIAEFRECHRDFALLLGDSHPKTVRAASGLAHALSDHGELEEASKIYRDVLTSREEMLGLNHPDTDDARNNLAVTLARHGEDAEAERLFNISLHSARSNHGNHHPSAAITLQNLGVIFHRRGQYTEAEDQFRQASQIMSRQMRLMNRSTSDRQRIYMQSLHRLVLDDWCTTVMSGDLQPDSLHDAVLGWKNSTYLRRQQIETEASSEDRDRLLRLNREISSLLRSGIEAEDHAAELHLLTERRERLERKMISSTSDWVPRSSAEVADSLDPNTVAIDFFEYIANSPAKELSPSVGQFESVAGDIKATRRMAMFVLAHNQLPRLMDMGEASEIASEVKRWRQSWGEDADGRLAAAQLSDRLWRPLVPLTEKATRLLVCPDGVVSGLPMSAIRIAADSSERLIDRFVIERVVSMVGSTPPRRNQEHTNLLLIGDVDYEFNGGEAPAVSTIALATPRGSIRYARLPGTRDEVLATKKLAEGSKQNLNAISLLGDQATESNVLDQLSRAKYAVLATHGFFQKQPSDITATQRVMSGFHPDVRSGIVLTGANASINRVGNVDDGILTALELKGFDLTGLRIAALSSCHSSEGVEVSGEGVLGLNRAFLAAGCQYTVSTLGPVDDVATQTLMTRFWTHVLVDELEPAVALRKAQLKLRESFVAELRGSRSGLFIEDEPDTIASSARFWAPFVLTSRWSFFRE